ncbi:hypothetical protein LV779_18365 [Streptomyces thinghirensis]|nr:hypothetical protein [Streptomyces thinghirensis]
MAARRGEVGEAFWRQLIDLSSEDGKADSPRDRLLLPGITDPAQAASLSSVWKGSRRCSAASRPTTVTTSWSTLGRRGCGRPVRCPG